MTGIDKVSSALSEWAFYVAKNVLPKFTIPQNSTIGNMMRGFFGMDPATYNIWNELGFLAEPLIQTMVTPVVGRFMQGIPEGQVQEIAIKFADAFVKQAKEKGSINLFGIELKEDAFLDLKAILASKFEDNG